MIAAAGSSFSYSVSAIAVRAAAILAEEAPGVAVTLSHELGRIGLLERENAALLNAALSALARRTIAGFREAIAASRIAAPLYLTQNDGTVMSPKTAMRLPVMSFASGATNSMRGAAFLSGMADAIVVDVGGTGRVVQLERLELRLDQPLEVDWRLVLPIPHIMKLGSSLPQFSGADSPS